MLSPEDILKLRSSNKDISNIGLILFKPGSTLIIRKKFMDYCVLNNLKVISTKKLRLNRLQVIGLYPKIFSFDENDLKYGTRWKHQTIEYITSGVSYLYLVEGDKCIEKLQSYKRDVRNEYGKIMYPNRKLDPKEFFDKTVKNIAHCVDTQELDVAAWLFS